MKVSEFSATAAGNSLRGTSPGTRHCLAGWEMVCEMPSSNSSPAMISTRIRPVRISTTSVAACREAINWVIVVNRTRSSRSATAPAKGETIIDGPRLQNAMVPTQSGEWVSCQASQSVATRCIHNPVQATALPE